MKYTYRALISLYGLLMHVAKYIHPKARRWVHGRIEQRRAVAQISETPSRSIWIHCASLGEFEQAKPIVDAAHSKWPHQRIVLSFFSSSGFDRVPSYPGIDQVFYLPIDLPRPMEAFIQRVQPFLVLLIKYEFWFNLLDLLGQKRIPYVFVNARFRSSQFFFKPGMTWFQSKIRTADFIFVQDTASENILRHHGIDHVQTTGDSRIDRTLAIAEKDEAMPLFEAIAKNRSIFLCGSIWKHDLPVLTQAWQAWVEHGLLVIVPHEVDASTLEAMERAAPTPVIRWSDLDAHGTQTVSAILVNSIGLLSRLYRYAHISYVGGGFGRGIHSILEPCAFACPTLIGPRWKKFPEATDLIAHQGVFSVRTPSELLRVVEQLRDDDFHSETAMRIRTYMRKNSGATDVLIEYIARRHLPANV